MANKKISELSNAGALTGGENVEIVQGGVNVKTTTQDIADLAAGGGAVDSVNGQTGVVVVDAENIAFTPAGNIAATDVQAAIVELDDEKAPLLTSASASTAGATITLDMSSQPQKMFVGSASFATPKTIAMSNTTGSLVFNFFFEVTNVAAVITAPADWLMSVEDFNGTDWTPSETGKYEIGGSWNGTNWYVKIAGPFN